MRFGTARAQIATQPSQIIPAMCRKGRSAHRLYYKQTMTQMCLTEEPASLHQGATEHRSRRYRLWRFLTLKKFRRLLQEPGVWFSRASCFDDAWELKSRPILYELPDDASSKDHAYADLLADVAKCNAWAADRV